ncbi:MAG: hypothetical protein WBP61_07005 [Nocardioides sp.]
MSENDEASTPGSTPEVGDDALPEDLQPTDDNPLAQPLDEDEAKSEEELDMRGGKTPEESADEPDVADDTDD